jgi:hypothetical protein
MGLVSSVVGRLHHEGRPSAVSQDPCHGGCLCKCLIFKGELRCAGWCSCRGCDRVGVTGVTGEVCVCLEVSWRSGAAAQPTLRHACGAVVTDATQKNLVRPDQCGDARARATELSGQVCSDVLNKRRQELKRQTASGTPMHNRSISEGKRSSDERLVC